MSAATLLPEIVTGKDPNDRVVVLNSERIDGIEITAPARWPTIDPRALHGLAGDFVKEACSNSEADPAAILFSILSTRWRHHRNRRLYINRRFSAFRTLVCGRGRSVSKRTKRDKRKARQSLV